MNLTPREKDKLLISMAAIVARKRLERGAGRKLPSTLTFNYPNVLALATFLDRELAAAEKRTSTVAAPVAEVASVAVESGDLDALSDEELEARLLARLEATR